MYVSSSVHDSGDDSSYLSNDYMEEVEEMIQMHTNLISPHMLDPLDSTFSYRKSLFSRGDDKPDSNENLPTNTKLSTSIHRIRNQHEQIPRSESLSCAGKSDAEYDDDDNESCTTTAGSDDEDFFSDDDSLVSEYADLLDELLPQRKKLNPEDSRKSLDTAFAVTKHNEHTSNVRDDWSGIPNTQVSRSFNDIPTKEPSLNFQEGLDLAARRS